MQSIGVVLEQIPENAHWVISELRPKDGKLTLFMAPGTLQLKPGFVGNIVWHVYTPGWEVDAVTFTNGNVANVHPQPDPNRAGCFITTMANTNNGKVNQQFPYTITFRNTETGKLTQAFDPVVESEAPPT